jgi:hypothetical protein
LDIELEMRREEVWKAGSRRYIKCGTANKNKTTIPNLKDM